MLSPVGGESSPDRRQANVAQCDRGTQTLHSEIHGRLTMTSSNNLLKTVLPLLMMTATLGDSFNIPDQEDPGICNTVYSTLVTRMVPYTETFKRRRFLIWRTETRMNYKLEYEPSWKVKKVCCNGYKQIKVVPHICQPVCEDGCLNGLCTQPNVCECSPGYARLGSQNCEPVCTLPCTNGHCSEPNKCTCDQGYIADKDGACEPHCSGNLPDNAYCAAPDTFDCHRGYNKTTGEDGPVECRPFCEIECINGHCVAPDKCKCMEGYAPVSFDDFSCEPVCEHGCIFGNCSAPNTCTCYEGYQLSTESLCKPICSKECINGTCVTPEVCSCDEGYSTRENASHVCDPVCTLDCINGECVAPNTCQCNEGFEYDEANSVNESWACRPSCTPDCGPYGTCIAPDTCSCSEGYQLANQTDTVQNATTNSSAICVPICNDTCVNSECTEPDVCSCYPGYGPGANGSANLCVPICEGGCVNGTCVDPNECQCLEGFILSSNENNSSCISLCYRNCSNHGVCANNQNDCQCNFGWEGDDCDVPTLCLVTLNLNNTNVDRIVSANETNTTVLDAKDSLPSCDRCANFVNNETLCYSLSEDDEAPMVICYIRAEMSCSDLRNYEISAKKGPYFQLLSVILAVLLAVATYLIWRHVRKRRNVLVSKVECSSPVTQLLPVESISETDVDVEYAFCPDYGHSNMIRT